MGGELRVSRLFPSGAVSCTVIYEDGMWCMMSFPSQETAESWADENGMAFVPPPESE